MRISVLAIAALGAAIASCSGPASEKPVDKSGAENAADSEAAAIEQEANSINQAAEKATALIEAEAKAEIKAMGGQAAKSSVGDTKSE